MNPIIEKCVAELGKETPSLDYIRGMLESLLVMNAPVPPPFPRAITHAEMAETYKRVLSSPPPELSDEDKTLLNAYEKGPIGKVTA